MKKLISLLTLAGLLTFATATFAQEGTSEEQAEPAQTETVAQDEPVVADETVPEATEEKPFHQQLKIKIIEGGPIFMGFLLVALILGLAIAFERIIYLNLATVNTKKLLTKIEDALKEGGVDAAMDVCRNTRGPVASIFYQGLSRYSEGIEMVEKSVVSYGSVQMGQMEKGLTWISLFIALLPMLGFMGTVIGMIGAFDAIEAAGDINPAVVAGGIKVALITTVGGLIGAMILQVFYNYILGKIDSLVNTMEDASISLVDILVDYNKNNK
jgi:biopolymer transport protein ExbB